MLRREALLSLLLLGSPLSSLAAQEVPSPASCGAGASCAGRLVFFGTLGNEIRAARFNPATGRLSDLGIVAQLERPTWLVGGMDAGTLYAVSETGNDGRSEATVHSFAVDPATGHLSERNAVGSGGGGATHLALDPASRTLFVANFGTGHVSALPVEEDGHLGAAASRQQDRGTGPKPRQHSAHAHGVTVAPGGRFLLVPDLGADRVFVYRFDPATRALTPHDPPWETVEAGSGPRHLVFFPDGHFAFLDSELTGEVTVFRWDGGLGRLHRVETRSTYAAGTEGDRSAAEIASSADGRFLYVSNRRAADEIVVFRVDAASGALSEVQRLGSGGTSPWSFTLAPGGHWMLVANVESGSVEVLRVDPVTGRLESSGNRLVVPKPTNVTFLPG
ncbi:lactonase family protein [Roseomonas elaeocarpi]|uniref:Lactonase family protein n=1 Tax=Roseomonas elaeocarpi TaxID=907779 RepID=A0ABV6JPC2_9PROT